MRARFAAVLAILAPIVGCCAFAADPPPKFSAAAVGRSWTPAQILVPGEVHMTINGGWLGPEAGCIGAADPHEREAPNPRNPDPGSADLSIYPTELCGVRVLIGGKPAELLYVSGRQINFKVPQDSAESGTVELRVVYQGQSSAPVMMKAGFEYFSLSLDQPAYTNMPVWLKVEVPFASLGWAQYPSHSGPAGFGCNEVEVRRNGVPLPRLQGTLWPDAGGIGGPCGNWGSGRQSLTSVRLPLHLLYRFDEPGAYEVHYVLRSNAFGFNPPGTILGQAGWTRIDVLPSLPNQRAQWLESLRNNPPEDAAQVFNDVLPGVLGQPDDVSFDIVAHYLYHPNAGVRRYAAYGLSYWPAAVISEKLEALLRFNGPNQELERFLAWLTRSSPTN